MITNKGCNHAPLSPEGQEVKALYFTKAPGDKYLSVYAQYNGDPSWVPLHLTVPATPDLQQVRDMDRNIAIDSGSYEDAHIYLRSADGNNMTAAYFTNAQGGGIQVGNAADYAALNLQPDGGSLTYGGAEVATQNWVKEFALTRKSDAVTNFNAVTQQGIYLVNYNLKSIPNYPNIGNNNNDASSGYLVVYAGNSNVVQYFYPIDEFGTMNRSAGYWYRSSVANAWEYRNGVLEIRLNSNPVHANMLEITGDYLVTGSQANMVANGYPDPAAGIPLMLAVKKRWGNVSFNYAATQEITAVQESGSNFTRKWIRSCFNWNGAKVWDAWNEVGLLRDVYTKTQLNASGAGGSVHWDNVSNKPTIVNTEMDPTVPAHVKAITTADISNWNGKENTANKSTAATLGTSNTLFPTQNAVKVYVDTAITNNNAAYIPAAQKGAANGVATLDNNGKIPDAQIPAIAITNTSSVASQAAMLALTAEVGDVAVRTDISKTFILQNAPATTLANWIELRSPTITNSDQVPEGTANLYFTNTRARNALSAVAPVTYNATTGAIGVNQANASTNGYLSSTDWNTFNGKLSSFTETDPVYTANDPKLVKSRQGFYGNGNGLSINNAVTEHGFAYADGTSGASVTGPFISAGQLNGSNNYLLQIVGAFNNTGNLFKVRTRNGDTNTWNPWRKIYTDADSVLTTVPGLGAVLTATNTLSQAHTSSIKFNSGFSSPIGGNANKIMFMVENGFTNGTTNGGIYWSKVHGGGGEIGTWNTASYAGGMENAGIEGVTDDADGTGIGMGLQLKVQEWYYHGSGMSNSYIAMKLRSRGGVVFPAYGDGATTRILTTGPSGEMGAASADGWIKNAPATVQSATAWITGEFKGSGFKGGSDNSYLSPQTGYWGLYTAGNGAHPLKTGGLTISDSYSEDAPVNGLSVKGDTWLKGNKTIIGRGISDNEEIAAVLGYADFTGNYEKIKFISRRFDSAARQNLYICVNTAYSNASASTADSRIFVDGTTGYVGIGTTSASSLLTVAGNTSISGSVQSNSLAGSGTNMVVADATGKLGIMPIPGAGANWFDYNLFPTPYIARQATPTATAGIDTNGGFAARVAITAANSYSIEDGDYSVIFQKDCTITLPNPANWPGRILKLRTGPYTGTFNGITVANYGASIASFNKAIEIQSINGTWQLLSYSAQ